MIREKPVRILHVVGGMNRGGIETWLMHVLRHIDRDRYQMDFLVHTAEQCAYDEEIQALGAEILPCLHPSRPWTYAQNFKRILRDHGPYDVVHSHVHHYSGYVLRLAHEAGVSQRIAHSHNDTSTLQTRAVLPRHLYFALMEQWIQQHATTGLAASHKAAGALFGPDWAVDPRWRALYCGIDLAPFGVPGDRLGVRAELGIPPDAFVIGHVGRFEEQKNHRFLLAVAVEVARCAPQARLLLVGDGPLRPAIVQQVHAAGLDNRVIFAGLRSDVPRLMLGAMDVVVLPSVYEGLPLVGMEAQAAGLPFVLADTITTEVDVAPLLVQRLSLAQAPAVWAETLLAVRHPVPDIVRRDAFAAVASSPFNIAVSVKNLEDCYVD